MAKTIEWIAIDDGYGIVGWGWRCPSCDNFEMFCDTDVDEVECAECHEEFDNPGDPDE